MSRRSLTMCLVMAVLLVLLALPAGALAARPGAGALGLHRSSGPACTALNNVTAKQNGKAKFKVRVDDPGYQTVTAIIHIMRKGKVIRTFSYDGVPTASTQKIVDAYAIKKLKKGKYTWDVAAQDASYATIPASAPKSLTIY